MKKLAIISLMAACCLMNGTSMAQKNKAFTGSVKFEIKYEGDFEPQQLANAPREKEQLISGNFTKTTRNLGGAFLHEIDMVDSIVRLWDLPNEKCAVTIPTPKKEDDGSKEKNYVIQKRSDSKVICGYNCQGYDIIVTVKSKSEDDDDDDDEEEEAEERKITITVYTTNEIGIDSNINSHFVPGLQGYSLYLEQPAGEGKKVINQAVEVKKKKINAIEFSIPANYKYFTPEQWNEYVRKMQQQAGGGNDEDDDY